MDTYMFVCSEDQNWWSSLCTDMYYCTLENGLTWLLGIYKLPSSALGVPVTHDVQCAGDWSQCHLKVALDGTVWHVLLTVCQVDWTRVTGTIGVCTTFTTPSLISAFVWDVCWVTNYDGNSREWKVALCCSLVYDWNCVCAWDLQSYSLLYTDI